MREKFTLQSYFLQIGETTVLGGFTTRLTLRLSSCFQRVRRRDGCIQVGSGDTVGDVHLSVNHNGIAGGALPSSLTAPTSGLDIAVSGSGGSAKALYCDAVDSATNVGVSAQSDIGLNRKNTYCCVT